jgi:hypothetical protein
MCKSRAKVPRPLPLPLPPVPGEEKACFRVSENKHAFEFRGAPCHCSPWLRWVSLINPSNIYLLDRHRPGAPIVRVYGVVRARKKHAYPSTRKKHALEEP